MKPNYWEVPPNLLKMTKFSWNPLETNPSWTAIVSLIPFLDFISIPIEYWLYCCGITWGLNTDLRTDNLYEESWLLLVLWWLCPFHGMDSRGILTAVKEWILFAIKDQNIFSLTFFHIDF